MANRYYRFVEQEYYHIYNRGGNKQIIFRNDEDYRRFVKLLYLANGSVPFTMREVDGDGVFDWDRGDVRVHIGAYCLMPNHFHLLVKPAQEDGVSKFMLKLGTSISLYVNKKYERTGALFEGSYKAKFVDSDPYLKYLYAYIHLNPFRSEAEAATFNIFSKKKLMSYQHSSLLDYLGVQRKEGSILSSAVFPEYFESVGAHLDDLREWLDYSK